MIVISYLFCTDFFVDFYHSAAISNNFPVFCISIPGFQCFIIMLLVFIFTCSFKGDLNGTIFSYDCRMRFLERALLASCKNRTQLSPLNIAFTYDCCRILKHVFKSYDIFRVMCVCHKDVVG